MFAININKEKYTTTPHLLGYYLLPYLGSGLKKQKVLHLFPSVHNGVVFHRVECDVRIRGIWRNDTF